MYSTHNEGESFVSEIFMRNLKNKTCKYMASISNNVYVNKLDDIVSVRNNIYHSTIKMKPASVKSSTSFDFNVENHDEDPKFEVVDHVRISKHRNIFVKSCNLNWSGEVFVIKKVRNTVPWACAIHDRWKICWNALRKWIAKGKSNRV